MLAWLQDGGAPITDLIGDLSPIGGAALIALCIKLAVSAYKDSATTSQKREEFCATQLAATVAAQNALTAELKASAEDERQRWGPVERSVGNIERGMNELLEHARRGR